MVLHSVCFKGENKLAIKCFLYWVIYNLKVFHTFGVNNGFDCFSFFEKYLKHICFMMLCVSLLIAKVQLQIAWKRLSLWIKHNLVFTNIQVITMCCFFDTKTTLLEGNYKVFTFLLQLAVPLNRSHLTHIKNYLWAEPLFLEVYAYF